MNRPFHFHYQTKTFPTPFTIFSRLQNTFIIFYLQPSLNKWIHTDTNKPGKSFFWIQTTLLKSKTQNFSSINLSLSLLQLSLLSNFRLLLFSKLRRRGTNFQFAVKLFIHWSLLAWLDRMREVDNFFVMGCCCFKWILFCLYVCVFDVIVVFVSVSLQNAKTHLLRHVSRPTLQVISV
jgi:hypothetical protein